MSVESGPDIVDPFMHMALNLVAFVRLVLTANTLLGLDEGWHPGGACREHDVCFDNGRLPVTDMTTDSLIRS